MLSTPSAAVCLYTFGAARDANCRSEPAAAGEPSALVVAFTVDVQTLDPRAVFTTQGGSMLGTSTGGVLSTDELGKLQPR